MFDPCEEYSPDHPLIGKVTPESIRKVEAIEENALECGWSLQSLYQNRSRIMFPCGHDWGLVCFLDTGIEIGAVTKRSITLIRAYEGTVTRFYRIGAPE